MIDGDRRWVIIRIWEVRRAPGCSRENRRLSCCTATAPALVFLRVRVATSCCGSRRTAICTTHAARSRATRHGFRGEGEGRSQARHLRGVLTNPSRQGAGYGFRKAMARPGFLGPGRAANCSTATVKLLASVSNNVNQIARATNAGQGVDAGLTHALATVERICGSLHEYINASVVAR